MVAPLVAAIAIPLLKDLAESGLGLLSSAIKAKGKQVIEEKLGVDIAKTMQTEEGRYKLLELQTKHEEYLLSYTLEAEKQSIERDKIAMQDRSSARDMNTRVNESVHASWLTKNIAAMLAIFVISTGMIILYITKEADVRTAVVGLMTLVLGFYFGSTSSSKGKDDVIAKVTDMMGRRDG
jgi:hypothetical protein